MSESGEDFFVAYGEVRREAIAFLAEAGYYVDREIADLSNLYLVGDLPLAKKEIEPDVFIQVREKVPMPELRFHLFRRTVSEEGASWDREITKPKMSSYRNPERVKFAIPKIEAAFAEILRVRCPHCGGPMAERKVKDEKSKNHGKTFLGCLRYPACRGAVAEWLPRAAPDDGKLVGVNCPDCGSPLVVRYVKREDLPHRGQSFIGCSGYPTCKRIVSQEEVTALRIMGGGVEPEIF